MAKFQLRYRLSCHCIHDESGSANMIALNETLPEKKQKIAKNNLCDVYNMDETGLFYCCAPNSTISRDRVEGLKADKNGLQLPLQQMQMHHTNLTRSLSVIAKNPAALKKTGAELEFVYGKTKKAWITGLLFQKWLIGVNKVMKQSNRKVLLLLINAPSHIIDDMALPHIEIIFLPANTKSIFQPMNAGIIA